MVLDGVLTDRQHRWLATERDEVAHFLRVTRLDRSQLPHLTFGIRPNITVRYFPDKLPIGIDPDGRRHVFVYLATSRVPLDCRVFLHAHGPLLRAVPAWTVRVLMPQDLADKTRRGLRPSGGGKVRRGSLRRLSSRADGERHNRHHR